MQAESVSVVDRAGTVLSYTYFEDEPGRRRLMHRVSRNEAVRIAQIIARAVTGPSATATEKAPEAEAPGA
jgi:hypothetical protein